jgi:predicted RNase H-like HicB family nuclease
MRHVKVLVEKQAQGYIAYPVGLQGVVTGTGHTYEDALEDVTSSIRAYIEANGPDSFDVVPEVVEIAIPESTARKKR